MIGGQLQLLAVKHGVPENSQKESQNVAHPGGFWEVRSAASEPTVFWQLGDSVQQLQFWQTGENTAQTETFRNERFVTRSSRSWESALTGLGSPG